MTYEEKIIRDLPEKSQVSLDDYFVIEDLEGTKLAQVESLRRAIMNSLVFDNVDEMKSSVLKEGDYCITLGYHNAGDGGAAVYKMTYEPAAIEDGAVWHYMKRSDTIRAKFVNLDGYITPEQFGAYGDGTHNDNKAIAKCIESPCKIKFNRYSKYKITKSIELSLDSDIDLNGCVIAPVNCNAFVITTTTTTGAVSDIPVNCGSLLLDRLGMEFKNIVLRNGNIDMSRAKSKAAISVNKPIKSITLDGIKIFDGESTCIIIKGSENINILGCEFYSSTVSTTGIMIDKCLEGDPDICNIDIKKCTFKNIIKAIILNSTNNSMIANIQSCKDTIEEPTASQSVFVINNRLGADINKRRITIDDITTTNIDSVVTNQADDRISIKNIDMTNAKKLLDNVSANGTVIVEDDIVLHGDPSVDKYPVFDNITGIIYRNTNSIKWDTNRYKEYDVSKCSCKLYDCSSVVTNGIVNEAIASNAINVEFLRNGIINITNTGNINNIIGGADNQVIGLKSSLPATLTNYPNRINVGSASVTISGLVLLKKIAGIWTKI